MASRVLCALSSGGNRVLRSDQRRRLSLPRVCDSTPDRRELQHSVVSRRVPIIVAQYPTKVLASFHLAAVVPYT